MTLLAAHALDGQVAFATGAICGLGEAITRRLGVALVRLAMIGKGLAEVTEIVLRPMNTMGCPGPPGVDIRNTEFPFGISIATIGFQMFFGQRKAFVASQGTT